MTIDWRTVRLVVFDMDGTLYDQRPLRRAMAWELARGLARKDGRQALATLRIFRKVREALGEEQHADFANEQYRRTARLTGLAENDVRRIVADWIDTRPLGKLPGFKAPGIDALFAALRRSGRAIAIWSDYPVDDKLAALGLEADHHIWSGSEGVGRLKPHPAGLARLLEQAGHGADDTLMIGDRFDRDWEAAAAIGARTLIRSTRQDPRSPTFRDYHDPLFSDALAGAGHG